MNTDVRPWPYPHVVIDDWLPWKLYDQLCAEWPSDKFRPISEVRPTQGYPDRAALHEVDENVPTDGAWAELYDVTHGVGFQQAWSEVFEPWLRMRFPDGNAPVICDSLL